MSRRITIFDTTLRDGEQSPGASMNLNEKLAIAHQLALLNVDVIEAGFPFSSPMDFKAVQTIANEVEGPTVCGLCRTKEDDIEAAYNAIKDAPKHRIHTFVGTSKLHVEKRLRMTEAQVLDLAERMVRFARERCEDVEFSAEDAMRTDLVYLKDVVTAVIEAGATTVNIPDTVGYSIPWVTEDTIRYLFENVPNIHQAVISVHEHNDLGLAVANSLAAVRAGAGQVECTINGIGERAGNCSLEEVVMAIKTRADVIDAHTEINTQHIVKTSRLVSNYSSFVVQPNKAIVGANAFRHEAGIHQHGVLMDRQTYEIMEPKDVGWSDTVLTLGPRSGKHGVRHRLEDLGYQVSDEDMERIYRRFIELADRKKQVYDEDLEMIMMEVNAQVPQTWVLSSLQITSGGHTTPTAVVELCKGDEVSKDVALGNGPIDAAYLAIDRITGFDLSLQDYMVRSVTHGGDAVGECTVHVQTEDGREAVGRAADTDVVQASAAAYLNAINRLLVREQTEAQRGRMNGV
ncbi:MAG: 2-isopropylmalate synthase [Armatimonadetes bacterium]|nr:2-isopropylmalate synthase [Armatimonadota bacterium]